MTEEKIDTTGWADLVSGKNIILESGKVIDGNLIAKIIEKLNKAGFSERSPTQTITLRAGGTRGIFYDVTQSLKLGRDFVNINEGRTRTHYLMEPKILEELSGKFERQRDMARKGLTRQGKKSGEDFN